MKYNGFYFWMFKGSMKQVPAEKYNKAYAAQIMKQSRQVYRQLVEQADDIGDDNPMAYNELFALAFVAPYIASGKKIPPETVQEMMRRSLYHIRWYFARTDLNTARGKAENKKSIVKYVRWYTPERRGSTRRRFRWTLWASRTRARAITASPAVRSAATRNRSAFRSSCRRSASSTRS